MDEVPKNPLYLKTKTQVYEADGKLHTKIGKHIDMRQDVFTHDKLAQCQQLIDDAVNVFFTENTPKVDRMVALLEQMKSGGEMQMVAATELSTMALSLKSQSETLGFVLVTNLINSMYRYCSSRKAFSDANLTVISKHLETLKVTFNNNLKGDGGDTGKELMKSLEQLIVKFA